MKHNHGTPSAYAHGCLALLVIADEAQAGVASAMHACSGTSRSEEEAMAKSLTVNDLTLM